MTLTSKLLGLAIGALALTGLAAPASAILITDLGPGEQTIVDGDKTFSNFTCNTVAVGTVVGDCSSIDVQALSPISPFGHIGISLQGALFAFSTTGASLDLAIGYQVTVNDPNQAIDAISLFFNGNVSGVAFTNVTETVRNEAAAVIGQATVLNPGFPTVLSVVVPLSETVQTAFITKDIGLAALAPGGIANISVIEQDYNQVQVPEPATLGLLGTGLISIGLALRRRRLA